MLFPHYPPLFIAVTATFSSPTKLQNWNQVEFSAGPKQRPSVIPHNGYPAMRNAGKLVEMPNPQQNEIASLLGRKTSYHCITLKNLARLADEVLSIRRSI